MPYQFSTTRPKRSDKPLAFGGLAAQQRDLFGVLAHPNQIETKIRLEALLPEIEIDQR